MNVVFIYCKMILITALTSVYTCLWIRCSRKNHLFWRNICITILNILIFQWLRAPFNCVQSIIRIEGNLQIEFEVGFEWMQCALFTLQSEDLRCLSSGGWVIWLSILKCLRWFHFGHPLVHYQNTRSLMHVNSLFRPCRYFRIDWNGVYFDLACSLQFVCYLLRKHDPAYKLARGNGQQ